MEHKVINTIFRPAHKKVLSAYPKNINVLLKKSATWNPPVGKCDNSCIFRHVDKWLRISITS